MTEIHIVLALLGAMDPDDMITIAFCLEFVLFVLGAGIVVKREVRKDRAQAAAEARSVRGLPGRSPAIAARRRQRTP
jgi:hypothetical protein